MFKLVIWHLLGYHGNSSKEIIGENCLILAENIPIFLLKNLLIESDDTEIILELAGLL